MEQQTLLSVGQVVYTNLYNHGLGVITQIHGEQKPDTVTNLCNVMVSGGNAEFDIVFYNGDKSNRLPESILRGGIQWEVKNEFVDNETIESLIKQSEEFEQTEKAEKEKKQTELNQSVEFQKNNSQYSYLTQITDNLDNKVKIVGKNIRAELKKIFQKLNFQFVNNITVLIMYHGQMARQWMKSTRLLKNIKRHGSITILIILTMKVHHLM
nr:hypothetical protein [Providencia sp. PROV129]